ncbi:MAG: outer membrane lipoprotein carrier protein LolA [Bacteroidaceae bacterium]|nr:outer membrane lipoprotein carrier protein LolA [Bacteroidaceae bacterium]
MKTILLSLCLFVSTLLSAQNSVLTEIEKANATYKTIEGAFTRTQVNVAKGTSVKTEGALSISGEDQMAQHYKAPCKDVLIINGNDFYMVRGKKDNKFNTAKNKTMRGLRNTLLYCVHGKPAALAAENGAEITAEKKANGYEVVLVSTKKTPRGYAKIALTYDLKTKLLVRMQMDEYNGNSTVYEMSNLKTNGKVDTQVFDIPEKK